MNLDYLFRRLDLDKNIHPIKFFTTNDLLKLVGWHPRMASRLSRALKERGYRQFRSVRGLLDADGQAMDKNHVWYLPRAGENKNHDWTVAEVRRLYNYDRFLWYGHLAERLGLVALQFRKAVSPQTAKSSALRRPLRPSEHSASGFHA
jgi:hypothetical protein